MKVSVLTITYNHEKYIAQAIESVLMQEVHFEYELVIGEDCSTDRTREIVVDYQKKYPHKIRLLLNEKNLGMHRNFAQTYNACRGQYIAVLEGDDFWTSQHKLQKQVDFLDTHRDFAICFHNMQIIYEDDSKKPHLSNVDQKEVSTIEDLFKSDPTMTASCLFRNKLFGVFPKWFFNLSFGDWALTILNAEHGKIMYIDEVMGVYRVHKGGVTFTINQKSRSIVITIMIDFLKIIDRHFNYKYRYIIRDALIPRYITLIKELIIEDNHKKAMFYLSQIKILDKHLDYKYRHTIRKSLISCYVSFINKLISEDNHEKARFYIFQLLKLGFWRNVSNRYLFIFLIWLVSPKSYQILKYINRIWKSFYKKLFFKPAYSGDKYVCPVCKTSVAYFNRLPDYYFKKFDEFQFIHSIFAMETLSILNYSCPACGVSDRDRLCALYLTNKFDAIDNSKKYKFIDFAPSSSLSKFIKNYSFLEYRSADLLMANVDDRVDIMDMNVYENDSIDFFLCSHILEHVENDRKAIQELYRILKSNSVGIIMAPILLTLKEVYENPHITEEDAKWKHFGQNDHVRIYSKVGFVSRLEEAGFKVYQLGIDYFGADVFERHGIHPRSVLYVVKK